MQKALIQDTNTLNYIDHILEQITNIAEKNKELANISTLAYSAFSHEVDSYEKVLQIQNFISEEISKNVDDIYQKADELNDLIMNDELLAFDATNKKWKLIENPANSNISVI